MGQKLYEDKIGSLSYGGGIVTLAPSRLTIGGQQYITTSNIQLTLPTLLANTLYMLYAVQSGGTVSLVSSVNANSTGPAGYTSWKLVGAFVTNYLLAFTQFLPIEGLPTIKLMLFSSGPLTINTSVTGYVHLNQGVDSYGLSNPGSGAYNSATGQFATSNPRVTNPIPGANMTIQCEIGWNTGTANITNTWSTIIRKNGANQFTFQRNGDGGNSAAVLSFMRLSGSAEYDNCAAGDYFEILALEDFANVATFLTHAEFILSLTKQIKDM